MNNDQIKENIQLYAPQKLAEMIIAHRYLGVNEGACLLAMEELVRRRSELGEVFPYEQYIEENLAKLPKLDFSKKTVNGLGSLLNVVSK